MLKAAQDIISLPIELTDRITESKFRLVHVASQRVRQLSAGAPAHVSTLSIKDTTISLEEALAGRLRVVVGEDAKKAREEFLKQQEQARLEEDISAKEEEIRKELSVYLSEAREEGAVDEAVSAEPEEEGQEGSEEPEEEAEPDQAQKEE
jgi:DNA-directed RNA polymerase omega subunit